MTNDKLDRLTAFRENLEDMGKEDLKQVEEISGVLRHAREAAGELPDSVPFELKLDDDGHVTGGRFMPYREELPTSGAGFEVRAEIRPNPALGYDDMKEALMEAVDERVEREKQRLGIEDNQDREEDGGDE